MNETRWACPEDVTYKLLYLLLTSMGDLLKPYYNSKNSVSFQVTLLIVSITRGSIATQLLGCRVQLQPIRLQAIPNVIYIDCQKKNAYELYQPHFSTSENQAQSTSGRGWFTFRTVTTTRDVIRSLAMTCTLHTHTRTFPETFSLL